MKATQQITYQSEAVRPGRLIGQFSAGWSGIVGLLSMTGGVWSCLIYFVNTHGGPGSTQLMSDSTAAIVGGLILASAGLRLGFRARRRSAGRYGAWGILFCGAAIFFWVIASLEKHRS